MGKWAMIHKYRRLVADGLAAPIKCPDCNDELFPTVGRDDEPVFKCLYCKSVINPGLHVWEQIERALDV